jgi:hypothetical protein
MRNISRILLRKSTGESYVERRRWRIILKWVSECELDSSGLKYEPAAVCFDHNNKYAVCLKGRAFLDYLSDC